MASRLWVLCAGSLLMGLLTMTTLAGRGVAAMGTPAEILASHWNSMGPMSLTGISIDNFGVVDGHIFRGEQPSGRDYASLAAIGVRTIVDLRDDARSSAQHDAEAAGLKYVHIGIDGHGSPTDAQASEFLKTVEDPANGVVYVHCAGGRHRTGSMIAVYRMSHDGWTVDEAYHEMLAYDFYTSGGHEGFKKFVYGYSTHVPARIGPQVAL